MGNRQYRHHSLGCDHLPLPRRPYAPPSRKSLQAARKGSHGATKSRRITKEGPCDILMYPCVLKVIRNLAWTEKRSCRSSCIKDSNTQLHWDCVLHALFAPIACDGDLASRDKWPDSPEWLHDQHKRGYSQACLFSNQFTLHISHHFFAA